MQMLRPHPWPTNQVLGGGAQQSDLAKSPSASDAYQSLRITIPRHRSQSHMQLSFAEQLLWVSIFISGSWRLNCRSWWRLDCSLVSIFLILVTWISSVPFLRNGFSKHCGGGGWGTPETPGKADFAHAGLTVEQGGAPKYLQKLLLIA